MKKAVLLILSLLLLLTSCGIKRDVCYYAYFGDSAFLLTYSADKNTLYRIDIPVRTLAIWAKDNGYTNMKDVMRDYAQMKENGFIIGNSDTRQALDDILDALCGRHLQTTEERMNAFVRKASVLKNSSLIARMNNLCSTNLTDLARAVMTSNPKVCCLDAGSFLMEDSLYSQKYFKEWLGQII